MSMTRGRPGSPAVRKGRAVGPDYPETNWDNPFNMGIEGDYGSMTTKTLDSMNSQTLSGAELPLHDNYNELFEKGK